MPDPPIKTVAQLARRVQRLDRDRRSAADQRDAAMKAARESGCTWREIAIAAGMTDHGVRKAVGYTR